MILVTGAVRFGRGELERLRQALAGNVERSLNEDGCEAYSYAVDLTEPDLLHITEMWSDEAALEAHMKRIPELMAPLAVYAQFACGIAFVLGLFTRWAGIVTVIVFAVAVWMVHWPQDFPDWWPALILVFLGFLFATIGGGRYSLDHKIYPELR